MSERWDGDQQFEVKTITRVGYGSVTFDDGWCLGVPDDVAVKAGDAARLYGEGLGRPVRGLVVNGKALWYRTEAEEEQRHKEWVENYRREQREGFERDRAKREATYAALPEVLQKRIDMLREKSPDTRHEWEPYELFCCEQAARIAEACPTVEAIERFRNLNWQEQYAMVRGLSHDHSGNTFGGACALALSVVREALNA